jgi:hypothetical protein
MLHRSIPANGLKARVEAVWLSRHHRGQDPRVGPLFGDTDGCRGASGPIPTWPEIQAHAVGALILGHDVSGTG